MSDIRKVIVSAPSWRVARMKTDENGEYYWRPDWKGKHRNYWCGEPVEVIYEDEISWEEIMQIEMSDNYVTFEQLLIEAGITDYSLL